MESAFVQPLTAPQKPGTVAKVAFGQAKNYMTQVIFGEKPEAIRAENWRPWINSTSETREMVQGLALHQAIRFRGGFPQGERLTAWVYVVSPGDPLHENGNPMACHAYQMKISNPA